MSYLILVRHGQSVWNAQNLFTGWVDVPLSEKGIDEANRAGKLIADFKIDVVYTSELMRAQMTASLIMMHNQKSGPVVMVHNEGKMSDWAICDPNSFSKMTPMYKSWRLNERMYGDLQGLNKQDMRDQFGDEQVQIWRRSFSTPPPKGESLEMTAKRTIPYFEEQIVPALKSGKNILVSAHGNSLRSIIMDLDDLSPEEVVSLELETGKPIFYEYADGKVQPVEVK